MEKEIDVLYIHPTRGLDNTLYSFMPIGVVGLLNMLEKEKYTVYGINYGIEKSLNPNYSIEKELMNINYKVLLIDLHWYEHCYSSIEITKISKKINPSVPVIVGGITSTIFSKEILENFECVDYILKGDSEKPLSDLINFIIKNKGDIEDIENIGYKKDNVIIDKKITYCCANIDEIDYVNDSFLKNNEKYLYTNTVGVDEKRNSSAWVYIGRGCKHNCVYCDSSKKNMVTLWGKNKMTYRSAEKVAEDIIACAKKGVKVVRVTHDLEMFGKAYYEKIFEIIRKSKVKIGFNYDCFQLPTISFVDDLVKTFDEENIIIDITLLSGNEKIRNNMGKLFSNDRLYRLLDYLKKYKIIQRVYYSINLVNEKLSDFNETIMQIRELIEKYYSDNFYVCYQRVVLDPIATMRGLKQSDLYIELNSFMDYYNYCQIDDCNYIGYKDNMSDFFDSKLEIYNSLKEEYIKRGFKNIY